MELTMHEVPLNEFERLEPVIKGLTNWNNKYLSAHIIIFGNRERIKIDIFSEHNREALLEKMDNGKFKKAEFSRPSDYIDQCSI